MQTIVKNYLDNIYIFNNIDRIYIETRFEEVPAKYVPVPGNPYNVSKPSKELVISIKISGDGNVIDFISYSDKSDLLSYGMIDIEECFKEIKKEYKEKVNKMFNIIRLTGKNERLVLDYSDLDLIDKIKD